MPSNWETDMDDGNSIFDERYFADPYRTYARLHDSGCPVHRTITSGGVPAWLVTGYSEVRAALTDDRMSRRLDKAEAAYLKNPTHIEFLQRSVLTEDPPEHFRYRKVLNVAFTPRTVERLRPRIEAVTDELLDEIAGAGEADLVSSLALALPIRIIAELLGIPAEHHAYFRRLGDGMLSIDLEAQSRSIAGMLDFLTQIIEMKRNEPAEDILSYWVTARDDDGVQLDHQEIIGLAMVVLVGGYDTSVGMIAAMLLGLLAEPERLAELRADPALLPVAIEEFLRLYGTVHTGIRRFASEDLDIGGQHISAGEMVLLSLAAADRDPRQFGDPDTLNFSRPNLSEHLAFGRGAHVCPGNALARIEMSVAIGRVLSRLPGLRLAVPADQVPWRRAFFIRIPLSLPVCFNPADKKLELADVDVMA
jgi:cytochrome P450